MGAVAVQWAKGICCIAGMRSCLCGEHSPETTIRLGGILPSSICGGFWARQINVTAAEEPQPSLNSSPTLPQSCSKISPQYDHFYAAPTSVVPRSERDSPCTPFPSVWVRGVTRLSPPSLHPGNLHPQILPLPGRCHRCCCVSFQISVVFLVEKCVPSQRLVLSCWVTADKSLCTSVSPVRTQSLQAWTSQSQAWSSLKPHSWPFSTVVWPPPPRGHSSDPPPSSSAGSAGPWGAWAEGDRDRSAPQACFGWGWLLPSHKGDTAPGGTRGPRREVTARRLLRARVCGAGHLQRSHTCAHRVFGTGWARSLQDPLGPPRELLPRSPGPRLARRGQSSQPERDRAGCAGRSRENKSGHNAGVPGSVGGALIPQPHGFSPHCRQGR